MAQRQIRRMPIVDDGKRLVGMLSLGDLVSERAPGIESTLRSISDPSEPDRSGYQTRSASPYGRWPQYGR
jgi:CBS-domain-containing membrane protein